MPARATPIDTVTVTGGVSGSAIGLDPDCRAKPLGPLFEIGVVLHLAEQDAELLSAPARDDVGVPGGGPQAPCDRTQHPVARAVAVARR